MSLSPGTFLSPAWPSTQKNTLSPVLCQIQGAQTWFSPLSCTNNWTRTFSATTVHSTLKEKKEHVFHRIKWLIQTWSSNFTMGLRLSSKLMTFLPPMMEVFTLLKSWSFQLMSELSWAFLYFINTWLYSITITPRLVSCEIRQHFGVFSKQLLGSLPSNGFSSWYS